VTNRLNWNKNKSVKLKRQRSSGLKCLINSGYI